MNVAVNYSGLATGSGPAFFTMPFRPVQYLGNKLRVLQQISDATSSLVGSEGRIADLFTGTSVVAQTLADRGYSVTAVDTQRYSVVFGNALLGIGRGVTERFDADQFVGLKLEHAISEKFEKWNSLVDSEDKALSIGDYEALRKLYRGLPLIWRDTKNEHHDFVCDSSERSALGWLPLFASIYAGQYFGVRQALAIDQLRHSAEMLRSAGALSSWQYNAALTGIMYAASSAVHSAGKHFAQPLDAGSSANHSFLKMRLLEDRSVCILSKFKNACAEINSRAIYDHSHHRSEQLSAEEFVQSTKEHYDMYYLDPPYTAQQYSRFYHVLETLVSYEFPQLICDGRITTGLYPSRRYKSAFSSKGKTSAAFRTIIRAAKEQRTRLLISYSESSRSSQGNARMISLEALLNECRDVFGPTCVDWSRMGHRYRQFNSASNANERRDDPEILITCTIR